MDAFGGKRAYRDLEQHIEELKARDLLYVVDEPVNKDTEMSALVRWQFRGGLREADRKAFLFNNITDYNGPDALSGQVFTGGQGSYSRLAMMFGLPQDTPVRELVKICRTIFMERLPPVTVKT